MATEHSSAVVVLIVWQLPCSLKALEMPDEYSVINA